MVPVTEAGCRDWSFVCVPLGLERHVSGTEGTVTAAATQC